MSFDRSQWRALLLLVAVLAAGAIAGVAAERTWGSRRALTIRVPNVLDSLDLTPRQREAADSILNQSAPRTDAIIREMTPRLSAIADSVNADLRALLTPAQRERLDSLRIGSPRLLLKQKSNGPGGERVDTLFHR